MPCLWPPSSCPVQVQMHLRAHCTMELWAEASHSPNLFVDWFCRLAVENSKEAVRKEMVAEGAQTGLTEQGG